MFYRAFNYVHFVGILRNGGTVVLNTFQTPLRWSLRLERVHGDMNDVSPFSTSNKNIQEFQNETEIAFMVSNP